MFEWAWPWIRVARWTPRSPLLAPSPTHTLKTPPLPLFPTTSLLPLHVPRTRLITVSVSVCARWALSKQILPPACFVYCGGVRRRGGQRGLGIRLLFSPSEWREVGAAFQRVISMKELLKGVSRQDILICCMMVSKHKELLGVNNGGNSFITLFVWSTTQVISGWNYNPLLISFVKYAEVLYWHVADLLWVW